MYGRNNGRRGEGGRRKEMERERERERDESLLTVETVQMVQAHH